MTGERNLPGGAEAEGGGEFAMIARYFAPLAAGEGGAFGLGDDAAVLAVPAGCEVVATCDTIVEGIHFFGDDPPESVGIKALAVNLSDLAAMGATPSAYLLSAAMPSGWSSERRCGWLAGFASGLAELQRAHGVSLVGGDTVAIGGPLCLTVTALGWVAAGQALRRKGAQPGDRVFVSGSIGDAGLGLAALTGRLAGADDADDATRAAVIDRYRRPRPRVSLGRRLPGIVHACIDVSDGLVADLAHVCKESGVGARLWLERVPVSAAALALVGDDEASRIALVEAGDDYEILFAVAPEKGTAVAELAADLGLPLTEIGEIRDPGDPAKGDVEVIGGDGRVLTLTRRGYRHF